MTFSTCPARGAKTPDLNTHLSIKRHRVHAAERSSIEHETVLAAEPSDVREGRPRRRTAPTRKQGHRLR